MKKLITIIIMVAFTTVTQSVMGQCSLSIRPSDTTVCPGSTVTMTSQIVPPSISSSLSTTMAAGNNHRGNMFDIQATNQVTITSFDAHPVTNTTIAIYYKVGSYVGFESNSGAWTYIGAAAVTANVSPTPTPVPVAVNITIPAGQTYAFYITSTNTAVSLNYSNGTSVGNIYASDANIKFKEGAGMEYPFCNGGSPYTPRIWNGVIHYTVPTVPSISYLWSTNEVGSSISHIINSDTQYFLMATVSGCPNLYDTVNITTSVPPVYAGSDVSVCQGDTALLTASGAVSYVWDHGITDNISFIPAATDDYIVVGTDSIGCTASDTLRLTVNNLPPVYAGPDQVVCNGEMTLVSGSGAAVYFWDNGITDSVQFLPVTGNYIVNGIDTNGCSALDTIHITIDIVNTAISVLNETITALDANASYQWIDCNTGSPIGGETLQSFTALTDGSYAVIVTDSAGCSDTSACQSILTTGIRNNDITAQFKVNPNPAGGPVVVSTGTVVADEIRLMDVSGKIIGSYIPVTNNVELDLTAYSPGSYFINIRAGNTIKNILLILL